jgi:hypothetical protein
MTVRFSLDARHGGARRSAGATVVALLFTSTLALAVCGDGVVDVGEMCDAGRDPTGTCCTALCTFAPPLTVCRPADGACDVAETCSGVSAACPTNGFRPAEVCRPAAGPCDLPETCSGIGPACPLDSFAAPGTECRASAAPCDVPESCTGDSVDCPADTGEPDTDADGTCDMLDVCPAAADPAQTDTDGDGLGDACDPCTNPRNNVLVNARLAFSKLSGQPNDDRVRFKAALTVDDTPTIDPLHKGLRLRIAGPLGVVFDAMIPPGPFDTDSRTGWRDEGAGRWSYRNGSDDVQAVAGIRRILLRQDPALTREVRIVVFGRGADFRAAIGQPMLAVTLVIDAPVATTGQCGETSFVTSGTDSDCRLLNGGHRLECRQKS